MINKVLKPLLYVGAALIPFGSVLFKEHTLPTPIHEDLVCKGIDLSKYYADKISDKELQERGFDPIALNHWRYGKLHPKYRRK